MLNRFHRPFAATAALALCLTGASLSGEIVSEEKAIDHTRVQLVVSADQVSAGESFWMGLRYEIDPDWHIYWKNFGDTGMPTEVEWKLPEGFEAGELRWPVPERYDYEGIISYVYHDEVVIYAEVRISEDWEPAGDSVKLGAHTEFLMCSVPCIPGSASFEVEVPVGSDTLESEEGKERLASMRRFWPVSPEDLEFSAYRTGDGARLVVTSPEPVEELPELYFFSSEAWVQPDAEQLVRRVDDTSYAIDLQKSAYAPEGTGRLLGVLGHPDGMPGHVESAPFRVDVPFSEDSPPQLAEGEDVASAEAGTSEPPRNFLVMLGLAFLGGLILNLMPCVFPVLGIKVMGFVKQAGEERSRVVLHGVVFTAGVLVSFWILSGMLIALRAGGEELGWGFQLQSPAFVFFIALFLLVFALNLSGLFAFGMSAVGVGSQLTAKPGFAGSFFSGVLATIVATPCAAPILAPALGFALTLPAGTSLLTFSFIALGLASPYLLLSLFPGLASSMPRPGAWMESLKQFMAFPLYATVAYLVWILADQVSPDRFLQMLLALVAGAMAVWVYGRWGQGSRGAPVRRRGIAVALALVVTVPLLAFYERADAPDWEPWSTERVEELRDAGRPIYVDFTARWCVTCQVNKRNVFRSEEVMDYFSRHRVAMLQADWTNNDPRITQELARFDRSTVPFNLVYRPDREEPVVLPELLTPRIVLEAFRGD